MGEETTDKTRSELDNCQHMAMQPHLQSIDLWHPNVQNDSISFLNHLLESAEAHCCNMKPVEVKGH